MALDDILVDVGDWVGLMDELPMESMVTLPDILLIGILIPRRPECKPFLRLAHALFTSSLRKLTEGIAVVDCDLAVPLLPQTA